MHAPPLEKLELYLGTFHFFDAFSKKYSVFSRSWRTYFLIILKAKLFYLDLLCGLAFS